MLLVEVICIEWDYNTNAVRQNGQNFYYSTLQRNSSAPASLSFGGHDTIAAVQKDILHGNGQKRPIQSNFYFLPPPTISGHLGLTVRAM